MKKIIIGSISAIALVVITAFQQPELVPSTELVIEIPNIEKEIQQVPSHDYKSGSDGVFDFDDRM